MCELFWQWININIVLLYLWVTFRILKKNAIVIFSTFFSAALIVGCEWPRLCRIITVTHCMRKKCSWVYRQKYNFATKENLLLNKKTFYLFIKKTKLIYLFSLFIRRILHITFTYCNYSKFYFLCYSSLGRKYKKKFRGKVWRIFYESRTDIFVVFSASLVTLSLVLYSWDSAYNCLKNLKNAGKFGWDWKYMY
jgi:hypothetical protein